MTIADQMAAIACPIDRAKRLTRLINQNRDESSELARLREKAVTEALNQGHRVVDLATWLGVSPARINQIAPPTARGETR